MSPRPEATVQTIHHSHEKAWYLPDTEIFSINGYGP